MKEQLKEKVSFEFIRYANCWEDPNLLLKAFKDLDEKRFLSVASAGDNSFSLLTLNPEIVVAVDVSKSQLHLVELKKVAIKKLTHTEILAFLGFNSSTSRKETYQTLKANLSQEAQAFWDKHLDLIEKGIIHQGKFERYFQYFATKILPWIHRKATVEELFKTKTSEEQHAFYHKKWNTWKWRLLFKIFFSKYVMGKYGRDPEFLNEVKVPVGTFIFQQAEKQLKSISTQENFILRYNLTGEFGAQLPHYLQKENFEIIKKNIDNLQIYCGFAQDAIEKYGTFTGMNLSNIFEYMPANLFQQTAEDLMLILEKNGKIAYWNLMVPRRISEYFENDMFYEEEKSLSLKEKDLGFFYNKFILETKI